jgi:lysozyme family protein
MKDSWKRSFDLMLDSEGGFQQDPNDSGNHLSDGRLGCTNLGVTQAVWEEYVGHKVSTQDMRNLTPALVEPMYRRKYWEACNCNDLPAGVDYLVFDFAVNAGVGRSIKTLQGAVGAAMDGAIGPLTLAAVNAYNNPTTVINLFSIAKEEWYKSLKNPKYEQGWLNRAKIVHQRALKMVG